MIFRFNRREIEKALADAVTRGVHVHALIAYTNRGGETESAGTGVASARRGRHGRAHG